MWRVASAVIVTLAAGTAAQRTTDPVERYLIHAGLPDVLGAHLRARLDATTPTERRAAAERLAAHYAERLAIERDPDKAALISDAAFALLRDVPEINLPSLRIQLARARYADAERAAERWRLRLIDEDERDAAAALLDEIGGELAATFNGLDRRARTLERRLAGSTRDAENDRAELRELVRQRSLSAYYGGWSHYYVALLSGNRASAGEALRLFGSLLNADGDRPTLERLVRGQLVLEHVARAALGSALAYALLDEHELARAWINEIARSGELPDSVRRQIFSRRAEVLVRAGRWDALRSVVADHRSASEGSLGVLEARLLAVTALEAMDDFRRAESRRELAEPIVGVAVADLIDRGEAAQVVDIARRFGTLPLDDDGFIGRYVRGIVAFQSARDGAGFDPFTLEARTLDAEPRRLFTEAADLLDGAFIADNAERFPGERQRCGLLAGVARFYAGDAERAAARFEAAYGADESGQLADDALWSAVIAMQRTGREAEALPLARLFIERFPAGERAIRLLLRSPDLEIDPERVAEVLLRVDPQSSLWGVSRRRLASVYYAIFREAAPDDREAESARFLAAADAALRVELEELAVGGGSEAAQAVIRRARQILDAAFATLKAPDLTRATLAFDAVDEARTRGSISIEPGVEDELTLRRMQLADATGNGVLAVSLLEQLESRGSPLAASASRLRLQRVYQSWQDGEIRGIDGPRETIGAALRLSPQLGDSGAALGEIEAPVLAVVLEAAAAVWSFENDAEIGEIGVRAGLELVRRRAASEAALIRLASLAEASGRLDAASSSWSRLSLARAAGTDAWFEARHELFRLLAQSDETVARNALIQHMALYPGGGPAPWGERIRRIADRLGANP